MEKITIIRPIQKSADIKNLKHSDLTNQYSNIFENFKAKSTYDFDAANKTVISFLKHIPGFADFLNNSNKNFKNFEVIFPKGVLKKIKSGEYILNKKVGTDDFLAFVKDKKTNNIVKQLRLREISELEKLEKLLPSLQNMAIMSSLNNLSTQLQAIEEKLSDVHKEFNNDRIGKIQAGYSTYLDALQMVDHNNRREALLLAHKSINEGRSQLIESAKERLEKINVGFFNNLLREITSWNHKKSQEENLKTFITEVFYIQRSSQIILTIYNELNEGKAILQSLAPFKDFILHLNQHSEKINEWGSSKNNWKEITNNTLRAIQNIPEYNELEEKDINIQIENYE